jgi:Reverse transcriptase (RNA-dependent DNA polymerase)
MELIIKDQLLSYPLGKHLISRHQHAFIIKHSTTTNLLESLHDWSVALNNSNSVDVIYIDFRRVFDSIVFTKLLYKLQCYGVSGRLLAWLSLFVTGRSQCVVVDNVHSSYVDVISGVPQGSVLGPILFVNDIDTICHSSTKLKLYADDLKLYYSIVLSSRSARSVIVTSKSLLITFLTGQSLGSSLKIPPKPLYYILAIQSLLLL